MTAGLSCMWLFLGVWYGTGWGSADTGCCQGLEQLAQQGWASGQAGLESGLGGGQGIL